MNLPQRLEYPGLSSHYFARYYNLIVGEPFSDHNSIASLYLEQIMSSLNHRSCCILTVILHHCYSTFPGTALSSTVILIKAGLVGKTCYSKQ